MVPQTNKRVDGSKILSTIKLLHLKPGTYNVILHTFTGSSKKKTFHFEKLNSLTSKY